MYKVIGVDGKEYGPVSLEQLREWVGQGRVNPQTKVQSVGGEWKPAGEVPELQPLFATASAQPPGLPGSTMYSQPPQQGLAITSLVLGLLSILCFFLLAGIPAVICGHIARGRAKKLPAVYGGAGLALAGLILGYAGIVLTLLILPAMLLPALTKAKSRAQTINCSNNMKQIGLAMKIWAVDHEDAFPWNASTNSGGTLELASQDEEGFDPHPEVHFRLLSNELGGTTRILVCPSDTSAQPAAGFGSLRSNNISYRLCTGTNVTDAAPEEVLAICPIHKNVLRSDGSVQAGTWQGGGRR